ncbi:serine/threonine protein kinase [Archangium violaceum]|uniref:serine/threonine protein kinase n=1 Tax=Archangium violaceum TaxID=83451 RepID=UPI0019526136|nr:serine/threonine-protein kinase [Archangium violaceum]QRN96895.1 serine/threonine protein kinase [Archangium violaceum]
MAEDAKNPSETGSSEPSDPGPRQPPPPPLTRGSRVAGYTVEDQLGTGGYGTVYSARCGENTVALKVLPLKTSGGWEEREVDVLRRLKHPHVVRLLGYFDWPENAPCFRVLVMEFVDGSPLDEWARRFNPSALEVVELLLPLLEALEAVHTSGVVHRDVKSSNILVRASDGQPMLVDFGAGSYAGAPQLTSTLPPGTAEYRGPEVWDFFRNHVGESTARYSPSPADDLWAVGVMLYWLLTDRLPFTGGDVLAVGRAVLTQKPVPPHVRNVRVPEALSRVCLRMLEKARESRYANAWEVRAALLALKARANGSWSLPLFEPRGPHTVTTRSAPSLADGQDLLARAERLARQPPLRGEAMEEAPSPSRAGPLAARLLFVRGGVWAGMVLGLAGLALALGWWQSTSLHAQPSSAVVHATLPFMSPEPYPIQGDTFFQVVAPPWKSPDVGGDAAPNGKVIPAPVVNARYGEKDMRAKNKKNVSPAQEEKKPVENNNRLATLCAAGALALTSSACAAPSALTQAFAKYEPKVVDPEELQLALKCPREAVEYMKKHGIKIGRIYESVWPDTYLGPPLEEIPYTEQVELTIPFARTRHEKNKSLGSLPISDDTQGFAGPFVIHENRVHARFVYYNYLTKNLIAQGKDPNQFGPVCMEAWYDGEPGVPYLGPGTEEDTIRTFARMQLRAVDHW